MASFTSIKPRLKMVVRIESLDHKLIQCLAGYVAFSKGLNPVLLTVVNNVDST